MSNYDCSGWATRNDLLCADGRTICKDAFKDCDGLTVPLIYQHDHKNPDAVLGHAVLENREEGVYAYCKFNDTENGKRAKEWVRHGDVKSLSIYANKLRQIGKDVIHGSIRELSIVLSGANPGAYIDFVMAHSEDGEELLDGFEANYDENIMIYHSEETEETAKEDKKVADAEKTIADVLKTLNPEQEAAVYAVIGEFLADVEDENAEEKEEEIEGGNDDMKHNIFDRETEGLVLSHSEMANIISDAKRSGSLKDAFITHGIDADSLKHAVLDDDGTTAVTYGMANTDYLFPDSRAINNMPDYISRNMDWVAKVIYGAKHLPFARVKSLHADITMDEARAKGYIKGNEKTNEVFSLLKRTTSPTTIYKKQKLDRDDIVDITDFDVVAWLKAEMRLMLDEEIARAALVGDGRVAGDDKISEDCIRPIWTDNALYTVRKAVVVGDNATDSAKAKQFIHDVIKSRKDYKGSGNPTCFTTEDVLTDCLLLEDGNGRVIYDTAEKLRTALRVSDIVTVPVMEGLVREGTGADAGYDFALMGIIVNMSDYGFGADKGGAINMFDDFDIDFNQQKYLIETRCSGALTKPHSAIALELKTAAAAG